jgi:hypothetical protein
MTESRGNNLFEDYARRRDELAFFDCSVWLGEAAGFPLSKPYSFDEMRGYMHGHRVTGGLVSHWAGLTLSPQKGNSLLLDTAAASDNNWRIILTGLPLFPQDDGPLPGHDKPHKGLAGVRLFPRSHSFSLSEWVLGPLLLWMEQHGLPLYIWHTEIEWDKLYTLARGHPGLPIVLETQREKILYHMRNLLPLMRDCENVHVDTSNLTGQGYVEQVVHDCGASRILYGSFFPVNDPSVAMGMLLDAEIGVEEKQLIASANCRRLLEGVTVHDC